jgi:uncharacterized membrane protein
MTRDHVKETAELPPTSVSNIQKVAQLELDALRSRSPIEMLTERVMTFASTTVFIMGHLGWFVVWIGLNTLSPWRFDPYPFSFLTLVVSLEAIVLTGFVLRYQSHMALLSDRRAHLDLQVNLLGEQELTAILQVVCGVASHVGVDPHTVCPNLKAMLRQTDVGQLADAISRELEVSTNGGTAADVMMEGISERLDTPPPSVSRP